jgi:hypothetical protein
MFVFEFEKKIIIVSMGDFYIFINKVFIDENSFLNLLKS